MAAHNRFMAGVLLTLLIACLGGSQTVRAQAVDTITFAGHVWQVRQSGDGGPGPNHWDPQNVWVDEQGHLHLKISYVDDQWRAAEIYTTQRFGFGRYQFQVIGRIDQLDPNVVLGLFDYPPSPAIGPDGTNEIDIEFARWGSAANPNGNYAVYPAQAGIAYSAHSYEFALNSPYSTHRFLRQSQQVAFQSLQGHTNRNRREVASWRYRPADFHNRIPQAALPVHINLWLFDGRPPTDGQEVELVIADFAFTPDTP